MFFIEIVQGLKSFVEVLVDILCELCQCVEIIFGGELVGVVIIVLVYFDDVQCQVIKDVVCLVGLNVLCLFNELIVVVVVYGLDKGVEGLVVIYDLGGGIFDIFILCLICGVFEVLVIGGDMVLGGDDFDYVIVGWVIEQVGFFVDLDLGSQWQLL